MSRADKTAIDESQGEDFSFFSRWLRRKHESRYGTRLTTTEMTTVDNAAESLARSDNQKPAENILTDDDMPDIANMTPDSDYTPFMSPGVSEALHRLALRKLFSSDVFNVCDGLDDYDEDYTQFLKLGNTITADMRHQVELKAHRLAEQLLNDEQQLSVNASSHNDDAALAETGNQQADRQDDQQNNQTHQNGMQSVTAGQRENSKDSGELSVAAITDSEKNLDQ